MGTAMTFDQGGNILVAGQLIDASQHSSAAVLKYDTSGNLLWSYSHRQNTNFRSSAYSLAVGADGVVYIAGWQEEYSQPGQCLLLKLTSSGDSVWSRTDSTNGVTALVDSTGNVYVVGGYQGNSSVPSIRTWKYGQSGQLLWRRDYSVVDSTNSVPHCGLLATDQGVFAVGKRKGSQGRLDYTVERYSQTGRRMWFAHTDTSDWYVDCPNAVCLDPWGNVIVTGKTAHAVTTDGDFLTVKFRASGAVEEPGMPQAATPDAIVVRPSIVSSRCVFNIRKPGAQSGIRIHDISGRMVRRLALPSGETSVTWNATGESGRPVGNGVYFVVAETSTSRTAIKFLVQR